VPGVKAPVFSSYHFKEFTVKFPKPVEQVNRKLLAHGYQGGLALKGAFPELGDAALYCVTEMHGKKDIDGLVSALKEAAA
jgi:glycine dehydrogenase subunit 1